MADLNKRGLSLPARELPFDDANLKKTFYYRPLTRQLLLLLFSSRTLLLDGKKGVGAIIYSTLL